MGNKRKKKLSLHGAVEGHREEYFLKVLVEIYQPRENGISPHFKGRIGGSPDKIIGIALKTSDRNRSFAWLDEDFEPDERPLGQDVKESLAKCWNICDADMEQFLDCPLKDLQSRYNPCNKKPTLIISQPVCVESIILRVLGKTLPFTEYDPAQREEQINNLKDKLKKIINGQNECEFYSEKLSKGLLEQKRKEIPELDLLISMITK